MDLSSNHLQITPSRMEAKQETTTVPAGAQATVLVKSERLDNGDYSQVKGYVPMRAMVAIGSCP